MFPRGDGGPEGPAAAGVSLPELVIKPGGLDTRLHDLGMQTVEIEGFPGFSKNYVVTSLGFGKPDAEAVRAWLTPELLAALELEPGWTISASGRFAHAMKDQALVDGPELQAFTSASARLLDLLLRGN